MAVKERRASLMTPKKRSRSIQSEGDWTVKAVAPSPRDDAASGRKDEYSTTDYYKGVTHHVRTKRYEVRFVEAQRRQS